HPAHDAVSDVIARAIQLRRQIVMIEDELPAEHLVKTGDDEEGVWRIVRMDDVESLAGGNVDTENEAASGEIHVLGHVSGYDAQLLQERADSGPFPLGEFLEEGEPRKAVDGHA